jgi:hypothetical protein
MELLRSFGAEPLIIHSTDTLKNHPLLFPRGETKLRSELERALEIAVHHYINNKDCLGHHKICDNHHRDHLHITGVFGFRRLQTFELISEKFLLVLQ